MTPPASILVTGGCGFVGSHFARLVHDGGRRVVVLDDGSGGPPATLPDAIAIVRGDLGDRALVTRLCAEHQVGALAHFGGKIAVGESVRRPDTYFDVNVVRTLALLGAIRDAGVTACVFSSSAAVYGEPTAIPIAETAPRQPVNPYGMSKLAVEHALAAWGEAYGLRWAALRYFNAAGAHPDGTLRESHEPETHLIPLALDAGLRAGPRLTIFGDDYATPDGTCIRDYVHVQDLAVAHVLALAELERGHAVGALNLGTGVGHSVRDVLAAARSALGADVPNAIGPRRAGDPPRLIADPTRAREVLGWTPVRSDLPTMVDDALRARRDD